MKFACTISVVEWALQAVLACIDGCHIVTPNPICASNCNRKQHMKRLPLVRDGLVPFPRCVSFSSDHFPICPPERTKPDFNSFVHIQYEIGVDYLLTQSLAFR